MTAVLSEVFERNELPWQENWPRFARAVLEGYHRISPLTGDEVCAALGGRKNLLVLEDSFGAGCVGQRLAAILAEQGKGPKRLILKNLGKTFAPQGSVAELERSFGLDAAGVAWLYLDITSNLRFLKMFLKLREEPGFEAVRQRLNG